MEDKKRESGLDEKCCPNMAADKYLSTRLTLQTTQAALDKVKSAYELEGCSLSIITEDRYSDAIDIMANHFTPDEPLCNAFGVIWEDNFERAITRLLRENLSVMMVSKTDNRVMGVRINGVMKSNDVASVERITYEPLRDLFKFLSHRDEDIDFYNRFGIYEAMHFFSLGVHKDFRRRGLGTRLLQACIAMTKELGFAAIKGEATSNYTQRIYEKEGFDVLLEMPYDSYMYKGEPLRNKTGPHNKTKVVAKVLT